MGRVPQASCTMTTPRATPGALGLVLGPKLSRSHTWIEGDVPLMAWRWVRGQTKQADRSLRLNNKFIHRKTGIVKALSQTRYKDERK